MREEIELLEFIFQNAKIAAESIARIRKERKKEDDLDILLKENLLNYKKISNAAKTMIERRTKKVRDISLLTKLATYMNVKLNGINEDSTSSVAKMLIQASTMGRNEIIEKINDYKIRNKNVSNIANRLLLFEEQNIENLTNFLKYN